MKKIKRVIVVDDDPCSHLICKVTIRRTAPEIEFLEFLLPEKAIEYIEQALLISREIKSRYNEEIALGDLGEVYRSQGQLEKATRFHIQSLAIARELKAH